MACGDDNEKERGGGRGSQRGEGSRSPAGIGAAADEHGLGNERVARAGVVLPRSDDNDRRGEGSGPA